MKNENISSIPEIDFSSFEEAVTYAELYLKPDTCEKQTKNKQAQILIENAVKNLQKLRSLHKKERIFLKKEEEHLGEVFLSLIELCLLLELDPIKAISNAILQKLSRT